MRNILRTFSKKLLKKHQKRCMSSMQSPPKGAGGNDNSGFSLFLTLGLLGGGYYAYQNPDVLPEPLRNMLPNQGKEKEEKSMTLEEYESWRAKNNPVDVLNDKIHEVKNKVKEEISEIPKNIPIKNDVSPKELKASLMKNLDDVRVLEAQLLEEIKKKGGKIAFDDRQQLDEFKDQKKSIKQDIKKIIF